MNSKTLFAGFFAVFISLLSVLIWQLSFSSINFYFACVIILIVSMLPFFASFEIKKVTSREVTLIATLIALAVVSRCAFYLIPQVKPIGAVIIVSAIFLGAERGYIIGAFSAFISNFVFGQGYWTPFQIVALGAVGLLAGLIFKWIKVSRLSMAVVGFLLCFAVYGLIVDMSTILMTYGENLNLKAILSVYIAGIPFNIIFGLSTAVFLFIFGEAFLKKADRLNTKYYLFNNESK